ncbi:MAG: type I methionyl aminopeptidase [Actinomycetes bacterium]|jgi:methionyl aminopeptidase|nr:type I methionyl aminopeptidase [Actinomycetes bacterium]
MSIQIKTPDQIKQQREACIIAARALRLACEAVEPGISTAEVDDIAERAIRDAGAYPTFLGYGGFPKSICASLNDEVVHGIPNRRVKACFGDIFSIDVGATFQGWVGDNANTVPVGTVDAESTRLIEVTRRALFAGIEQCVPGNRLGDVCAAIGQVADEAGLGILRDYVGHGVGRVMHEDPNIPNYGRAGTGPRLKVGMVFAIEPMFTLGGDAVRVRGDEWTVITADGSRAAHIEHTVAITDDGPLILTLEE